MELQLKLEECILKYNRNLRNDQEKMTKGKLGDLVKPGLAERSGGSLIRNLIIGYSPIRLPLLAKIMEILEIKDIRDIIEITN
ncbi:MAG: hypothetical protein ACFFD1_00800 [Candidatus Thorarchaeota archaeon]